MFEDLRELAYPEPRRSYHFGMPALSRSEMEAWQKDQEGTDEGSSWKQSLKVTNRLFRGGR